MRVASPTVVLAVSRICPIRYHACGAAASAGSFANSHRCMYNNSLSLDTLCLRLTVAPSWSPSGIAQVLGVDSSTAGPGRHHGRPGKWENRGLLGSSLDRVLDNDASLMLTTVWKRGKPAKMAVRAQENRACGAKKRRASRATRGLKRRPCGRPHTPVGESSRESGLGGDPITSHFCQRWRLCRES